MAVPAPLADIESSYVPTHPEEIHGGYDIRVGNFIRLQGTGRITPAGLVCGGICAATVLLATAVLVRAARGR
ncbi:hypothetical protein [Ancylobacter defluvii]|uniref:Uncharacterized protein n=1 Tax=Ancylobacter defluvii TaxID=1282440 RepID=A0A9W6JYP8_9HYPH|nr:hypothetical protein [Ancylobacter defluvii]MBS7588893.1 hypothetical protein [Ancylobacter defluvii]GLK86355.1 hypothetical protein GCM10017653_44250 [Ancylobacter defluvii]